MSYANMSIDDVFADLAVKRRIAHMRANSPGKIMSGAKHSKQNRLARLYNLIDRFEYVKNRDFKEQVKKDLDRKYGIAELDVIIQQFPEDGKKPAEGNWWDDFWGQDQDGRIAVLQTRRDEMGLGGEVSKTRKRKQRRKRSGRSRGRSRGRSHGRSRNGRSRNGRSRNGRSRRRGRGHGSRRRGMKH